MNGHTLEHTAAILAKIAAVDRRIVGEVEIMAWHEVLGDLDPNDCLAAVATLRKETDEWLMPVHIRRVVADIEKRRLYRKRQEVLARMQAPDGTPMVDPSRQDKEDLARLDQLLGISNHAWWNN